MVIDTETQRVLSLLDGLVAPQCRGPLRGHRRGESQAGGVEAVSQARGSEETPGHCFWGPRGWP